MSVVHTNHRTRLYTDITQVLRTQYFHFFVHARTHDLWLFSLFSKHWHPVRAVVYPELILGTLGERQWVYIVTWAPFMCTDTLIHTYGQLSTANPPAIELLFRFFLYYYEIRKAGGEKRKESHLCLCILHHKNKGTTSVGLLYACKPI